MLWNHCLKLTFDNDPSSKLFVSFVGYIDQEINNLTMSSDTIIDTLTLTVYLFLWSTFFGAAYCFKKDAHISVDLLLTKVAPRTAKIMMVLTHTVTLLFLVAVAWYGYKYLLLEIDLDERSVDLEIPMWIPYSVVPIAFASAAFRVVEKIVDIVRTPADEVVRKSEAEMILAEMEGVTTDSLLEQTRKQSGEKL